MVLYEYRCDKCGQGFSIFRKTPSDRAKCPACGKTGRREYTPPTIKVSFREGYHMGLDRYVGTQREYDRIMKEEAESSLRGLEEPALSGDTYDD